MWWSRETFHYHSPISYSVHFFISLYFFLHKTFFFNLYFQNIFLALSYQVSSFILSEFEYLKRKKKSKVITVLIKQNLNEKYYLCINYNNNDFNMFHHF